MVGSAFLLCGHSYNMPSLKPRSEAVERSRRSVNLYNFYLFLVSFLFYMENRESFMKRNAELCGHDRKMVFVCFLVICFI